MKAYVVDSAAVRSNLQILKERTGSAVLWAVLKGDGYGLGLVQMAAICREASVTHFAVTELSEVSRLRAGGFQDCDILMLRPTADADELTQLLNLGAILTVSSQNDAAVLNGVAEKLGMQAQVHIKIDTGMSRLGFLCGGDSFDEGVANVIASCRLPGLLPEGIYTHFAVSDEPDADSERYTHQQFDLFCRMIDAVAQRGGVTFAIRHCANTGAVVHYPEMALDMVRPGLLLYGYGDDTGRFGLRPCMRLVTTISTIKTYEPDTCVSYGRRFRTQRRTRMAVLGIGYADGLFRTLSGKCSFAVAGHKAPQCGSICMDMCMIDVTDIPDAAVGSQVEIFGPDNDITALSDAAGTIPYELLCAVSKRVPRVYPPQKRR